MKKFLSILPERDGRRNIFHFILVLLLLALFAFPLLPLKVTNILLMLLSGGSLFAYFNRPFSLKKLLRRNLVFVIPFIPYLIEFLISGFQATARFEFEKKLFFFTATFFIPLCLQATGFTKYKLPLLIFSISVLVLTIFADASLLIQGIPFHASAYENSSCLLRDKFELASGLHPTYYSIFAICSACFLFDAFRQAGRTVRVMVYIFSVLVFVTVLFLAVRVAIITLVIFLIIWMIRSEASHSRKFIAAIASFVVLVGLMLAVPSLRSRISEVITWKTEKAEQGNTISQRAMIIECSAKVFADNLLVGTGSRYFQKELNDCYAAADCTNCDKQSFNPHNQYLSVGINYGIFFLLAFLVCLYLIFQRIIKIPAGIYFIAAVVFFFFSESLLERQMGVYFFGLIALLLYNFEPETFDTE